MYTVHTQTLCCDACVIHQNVTGDIKGIQKLRLLCLFIKDGPSFSQPAHAPYSCVDHVKTKKKFRIASLIVTKLLAWNNSLPRIQLAASLHISSDGTLLMEGSLNSENISRWDPKGGCNSCWTEWKRAPYFSLLHTHSLADIMALTTAKNTILTITARGGGGFLFFSHTHLQSGLKRFKWIVYKDPVAAGFWKAFIL